MSVINGEPSPVLLIFLGESSRRRLCIISGVFCEDQILLIFSSKKEATDRDRVFVSLVQIFELSYHITPTHNLLNK